MERLAVKANLPVPKLYVIPEAAPNAFATGRNPRHASVAVTEGLLQLMNDDELEGVIAHELSHVRNYDILISSVAATLAGLSRGSHIGGLGLEAAAVTIETVAPAPASLDCCCSFWRLSAHSCCN
jgi:Zn-dependent protease with chaperone function